MDTGIEELLAKKAEKKIAAIQRKAEKEEKGIINKLLIERNDVGLYSVRYKEGGPVPDVLKTMFTRKDKLIDAVRQHYGSTDLLEG